ncbi:MAG: hypothetical protein M3Q29_22000 [Chloroflexota bacterium]|nr:hypothetical protein [Chloroflexota bacterium]
MAKDRHVLFLSPDVVRALTEYTRLHRLGSVSQSADQLLRRALLGEIGDCIEALLIPSIREAVRLELAALDGDGQGSFRGTDSCAACQTGGRIQPLGTERQAPKAPDGRSELAKTSEGKIKQAAPRDSQAPKTERNSGFCATHGHTQGRKTRDSRGYLVKCRFFASCGSREDGK